MNLASFRRVISDFASRYRLKVFSASSPSPSSAGSQNISVPSPSHASHAPRCELNEKCFGESSTTTNPVRGFR